MSAGSLGIVTDGLVFSIDPYNTKSYVSGDTTTYDLTKNGKNGTLINGVTFDDKNFVMDGTNQRITLPDLDFLTTTSQFSYDVWVKFDKGVTGDAFFSCGSTATNDILMAFAPANNQWFCEIGNGLNSNGVTPDMGTDMYSLWNHMSVVYDGNLVGDSNRLKIYINAEQQPLTFAAAIPSTTSSNGGINCAIGYYVVFVGWDFGGLMGPTKFWNRPLTSQEVLQNYNTLKWRFIDKSLIIPKENLVSDWDAEKYVYSDSNNTLASNGQLIEQWVDYSSGLIASGSTGKPTYYTSGGLSTKPYVDFDGTDDFLEVINSGTYYTDEDITFYIVSEVDTSEQYETHFHRGENYNWESGWIVSMDDSSGGMSATVGDWSNNEVTNVGGSPGKGQLNKLEVRSMRFKTSVVSGSRVINIRVTTNSYENSTDNQVILTGDDINDAPNKNAIIGASYNIDGTGVQSHLDGRIYRILIYNKYHDDNTYKETIKALLNLYS